MTIDQLLDRIESKQPPAREREIRDFESEIGADLPADYRGFLADCNGGTLDAKLGYVDEPGIVHIGGFRKEPEYSLRAAHESIGGKLPRHLVWIMDDQQGRSICIGVDGDVRRKVYACEHAAAPADADAADIAVDDAEYVTLLAGSFTEFVFGLVEPDDA